MYQEWQVRKGTNRQNRREREAPHCLLSSSVPWPVRKSNAGWLPTLHARPEKYKSQPDLAIFASLPPEMT